MSIRCKETREKDYYKEINGWIDYLERRMNEDDIQLNLMVTSKITWCLKFKKINIDKIHELCDRITNYMDNMTQIIKQRRYE